MKITIERDIFLSCKIKTFNKPQIQYSNILNLKNFPIAFFGNNSYIGGTGGEIHSGFLSAPNKTSFYESNLLRGLTRYTLNFHVGNATSIATNCKFIIALDHDIKNTYQGQIWGNNVGYVDEKKKFKGQVLIQNDVWIGMNATIMDGVTISNGAVVAANSHVVKDVQPYSIVGGNPAKHIRFRFNEEIIKKLQIIQWWFWDENKIIEEFQKYPNDVEAFVEKFYEQALIKKEKIDNHKINIPRLKKAFVYFSDASQEYSTYIQVILGFVDYFKNDSEAQLTIYIKKFEQKYINNIVNIISEINIDKKCIIGIYNEVDENIDSKAIFKYVDYYISNRSQDVNFHSCYADMYGVKKISGVDIPLIDDEILK